MDRGIPGSPRLPVAAGRATVQRGPSFEQLLLENERLARDLVNTNNALETAQQATAVRG